MAKNMPTGTFYEFFSGGGMARMGLGPDWTCLFANDFDRKKGTIYTRNWRDGVLRIDDIRELCAQDLPGRADLIWASFPCQDLSLAGNGSGLSGERSGTFWPFWNLMKALIAANRAPAIITLENVCGALTSHDGKDFTAICSALSAGGYRVGAIVVDAALFVPQSRPRLFIIAVNSDVEIPPDITSDHPDLHWHGGTLNKAFDKLPYSDKSNWIWWTMPKPPLRNLRLADLIEDEPGSVRWHTPSETRRLISMMSDLNLAKVSEAQRAKRLVVGTIYKRTRLDENGQKIQRAEVRFDDLAGCLRTPAGGSSRQVIMVVDGAAVRSRLISSRETARLMGLPDEYILPENYNEAYHLTGDGVVVPVVRYLATHLIEPMLTRRGVRSREAA